MTKLLIATLFFSSSLLATCVPQSGSAKNVQDLNDRACATEAFTVGTGGVTANTVVITDSSNPAKIVAGTGSGAYGIAVSSAAATASVQVQRYGQIACVMDNAATAGDLVIPGTSTANDCRDSGQTASSAIPMTTRIIGVLMTSATAGSTAIVELTPAHFGTQTSSVIVPNTGWTLINGGGVASLNDFLTSRVDVMIPDTTALNWRLATRSLNGASTYTIQFELDCSMGDPAPDTQDCGFYLSDGTKLEGVELLHLCGPQTILACDVGINNGGAGGGAYQLRVEHISNVTTDGGGSPTVYGPTVDLVGSHFGGKVVEDGTHRTFFYWAAGAYHQFFQEATGTWLTPTTTGFGGVSVVGSSSYYVNAGLIYWNCSVGSC